MLVSAGYDDQKESFKTEKSNRQRITQSSIWFGISGVSEVMIEITTIIMIKVIITMIKVNKKINE